MSIDSAFVSLRSDSTSCSYSGSHLYYFINPIFFSRIVIAENEKKATNVPSIPKSIVFPIFAKKFHLLILKPEANTIGGKQKKKNVLSSN